MSGYGDLVQILGVLNRPIGITMNDKGMNIRVKELESTNRKEAMILLSKEPREVMRFLGLDAEKWKRGFTTQDEIFSWCSAGHYYSRPVKITETTNDRARYKKRPMFTRFVHEWVAGHPEAWQKNELCPRKVALEDAIKQFGVQDQYEVLMTAWVKNKQYKGLVEKVGGAVPAGKTRGLNQTMRGIKRWVTWENGSPVLGPEDQPVDSRDAPGAPVWLARLNDQEVEDLVKWIRANYVENREREQRRGDGRRERARRNTNVEA